MKKARVVVGMSGGVDSAVTALLLKRAGHEVIGLFMKNWEETDENGVCSSTRDAEDAARVCEMIGAPFYQVNFVQEYQTQVFDTFLEELKAGLTPNPDILCNREIKFRVFFDKAMALGADYLATGHYACTENGLLYKGIDPGKDQSYFLYTLKSTILKKVLFPIGHLHKKQVRILAEEAGLPVHDKKDSTGICFIGKRDFKPFLHRYMPYTQGDFVSMEGKVVGKHDGAAYYTIGQRKGLGIGGAGDAWFVVSKNMERNQVFVAQGHDHPSLYAIKLIAQEMSWVADEPTLPLQCRAKIRYRQEDQPCTIEKIEGSHVFVSFDSPQRAITSRQSIVFYQDNLCLGGAFIQSAL